MMLETDPDLQPLSFDEIMIKLKALPGWEFNHDKIAKTFVFDSFSDGINFLVKLAPFCNEIDHHPDIHIYYRKIKFELSRFSIGGKVTKRDFTVAKKIEKLSKK